VSEEHRKPLTVVTPYRMTMSVASNRIRDAANAPGGVVFGTHARERMLEREIDDVDVFRILRKGHMSGEPVPAEPGEWKCKLAMRIKGARDVGVVAIILRSNRVFVKTVEWEDLR
jgi:hypothetical protein